VVCGSLCPSYRIYDRTVFFPEKYDYVGRLLKPGEEPTNYSEEEEEEEGSQLEPVEKPKDEWEKPKDE